MNELIEQIFANFIVDKETIPVSFMFYEGHGEPYVVYMEQDADKSLSADDDLVGYVDYYDFDVYSKGNYNNIIEQIKTLLKQNGFVWSTVSVKSRFLRDRHRLLSQDFKFCLS